MKGQSTLEFLFAFIFSLSFLTLGVLTFTFHWKALQLHWLSFEAGRLFLVKEEDEVRLLLEDAISKLKGNLKFIKAQNTIYVGAVIHSDQDFFQFYPFRLSAAQAKLVSESYLGKEPSKKDCEQQLCSLFFGGDCRGNQDVTLYDDGC